MLWRFEVDGYVVGLDANLEWEFRNPRGGRLKQTPKKAEEHPERAAMARFLRKLRLHRNECAEQAQGWADRGVTAVPGELAADPVWGPALEAAGIGVGAGPEDREESPVGGELLVGRVYEHSVTGHRIVQVVAEEAARYRDMVMRHAGWERTEGFQVAFLPGAKNELPWPERALAAHPGMEETVLAEAEELFDLGLYKKGIDGFFKSLEQRAPGLVPLFLDEIAQYCLRGYPGGHGDDIEAAAAYFGRARLAERERGLPMDYDWLDGRYTQFAMAGAISATTLRARAKELAVKGACTPEHVEDFREMLCCRVDGDVESEELWVYAQLPADLAKVARAAGLDPEEELATLLVDSGLLADVSLAEDAFWATVLKGKAYDLAVAQDPEAARTALLRLVPTTRQETHGLWMTLVERSGLLTWLTAGAAGAEPGEAAGWLSRCIAPINTRKASAPLLHDLAQRLAPRLRADGVALEIPYGSLRREYSEALPLDLLDELLGLEVPVADPPPLFGRSGPAQLLTERRPELRHLRADARFAPELRRMLRALLDMTDGLVLGGNSWYQPYEDKGWAQLPEAFANDLGRQVLGEWGAAEREWLRGGGFGVAELAMLLGRFVHAGAVVDALPEDVRSGLAKDLAAVDPVELLLREMPEDTERAQVEKLVADGEPKSTYRVKGMPLSGGLLTQEGVNCRVGLAKLIARLEKRGGAEAADAQKTEPKPAAAPRGGVRELCADMAAWARDGELPVWQGNLTEPSARSPLATHAVSALFYLHSYTPRQVLAQEGRWHSHQNVAPAEFGEYATYPFLVGAADGSHREWRIVTTAWGEENRGAAVGRAYRTESSVAVVLSAGPSYRLLLEHAPGGTFPEGGPLAAAGLPVVETHEAIPQRPPAWYAGFARLCKERGARPVRPALAVAFGAATGLSAAAATALLLGRLEATPYAPIGAEVPSATPRILLSDAWEVREADVEAEAAALRDMLDPDDVAKLYDLLVPDDPELLWTQGPDVARAARWWCERFGAPIPVPAEVLPTAQKECVRPTGENAFRRNGVRRRDPWWPVFRFDAVAARVATGTGVLDEGLPLHAGPPDLLGSVRVAAWLAYRTPLGDPLRPAIGAAVGRLRAEVEGRSPGSPVTVFATQSNYLMGAPESVEAAGLTGHPAVSVEEDATYDMRNVRVDPALLRGPADPVLDRLDAYLDSVLPSQWVPAANGLPGTAELRMLLSEEFAELGRALAAEPEGASGWAQDPTRSAPQVVEACALKHGLSADAAAYFLMLAVLPDPTDRMVKFWTGWKPARFRAAREELAASGRVLEASRTRAGRSLFVAGEWAGRKRPRLPLEAPKVRLLGPLAAEHRATAHVVAVPSGSVAGLFRRWGAEKGLG
ncbi:hypothetical protein ACFYVL_39485 [Streptomyces sp. NPDC004111]|uniref:hypothetical protein n=1 Tax=Streptomyces sp. NPDC004111 TaxID=3364690 RepID=UPI0036BF4F57